MALYPITALTMTEAPLTPAGISLVLSCTLGVNIPGATDVETHIGWKLPDDAWLDPFPASGQGTIVTQTGPSSGGQIYEFPALNVAFDVRARTKDTATSDLSDWVELSYVPSAASAVAEAELDARMLTYKQVRDGLITRKYSTTPDAAEMARIAEFITAANRLALQGYKWSELLVTEEVACDNGRVLWAAVRGASERSFFTADPRPANSTALPLQAKSLPDEDGVWLDSGTRTSVWVQYVPRLPRFSSVEIVGGTAYGQGAVRYLDSTGHCYECIAANGALGSEVADTTKWRPLPLLWETEEVVKSFAEAACYSRSEERGQASSIRAEARENLAELQFNDCRNSRYPR